jgi:glycosyltransferase involved in cell wall biosynthesis
MRLQGYEWIKEFTWDNTAKKTIDVYKRMLQKNENIDSHS